MHLHRGYAWGNKGEYDNAIADFTEAIRLGRELDRVNADRYRSRAWSDKGQLDKAEADFNEAIRLHPKNAGIFVLRGNCRQARGEYDTAIADYDQALRLDPKNARAFLREAGPSIRRAVRPGHRRLRSLHRARTPKDPSYYYGRASAWHCKGVYERAIADYTRAIQLDPKNVDAYYYRGRSWIARAGLDKAIADYSQAIRLDPGERDVDWQPRLSLVRQGPVRRGFRRFQRGHPARLEACGHLHPARPRMVQQGRLRPGPRRL